MKRLISFLVISVFIISVHSQTLYKDAYFGQAKEQAHKILNDTSFFLQYGDYVINKISGFYVKGNLIAVWMSQDFKTAMKFNNLLNGNKGIDITLATIEIIKKNFAQNGYSVVYENLILKPASKSVTGMTMGTCLIFTRDSILTGITYTCSINQFGSQDPLHKIDEFDLVIKKTSLAISDKDYRSIFNMDRNQKQSDIF